MKNVVKVMLVFAVFALPLGGFIVVLTMAVNDLKIGNGFVDLLQVASSFVLFSYLFGGFPLLLTGAVSRAFRIQLRGFIPCLAIGLLGYTLSFLFQYKTTHTLSDAHCSFLAFGAPAFLSGAIVSVFFGRKIPTINSTWTNQSVQVNSTPLAKAQFNGKL